MFVNSFLLSFFLYSFLGGIVKWMSGLVGLTDMNKLRIRSMGVISI